MTGADTSKRPQKRGLCGQWAKASLHYVEACVNHVLYYLARGGGMVVSVGEYVVIHPVVRVITGFKAFTNKLAIK